MKIISWNTNGLRATVKQGNFDLLFKDNPDIVCLQEIKAHVDQLTEDTKNVPGYHSYFSHSKLKKGYSGVAIYTKEKPLEVFYGMDIDIYDIEDRMLVVKFKDFTLINVYFPNGGQGPARLQYKLDFYETFLNYVLELRKNGERVIFCGDVNTAHQEIDLARPKANENNTGFLPIERAWLDKVVKNNFVDVFRKFNPEKTGAYTYWDQKTFSRERNIGWRIDYFFVSSEILDKVKDTGIMTDYYGSDHCPIWMEINF